MPELQKPLEEDNTGAAILKADAIKFFMLFRAHIPREQCVQLLPACVAALGSQANVVHSYAATCIERLLTSKVCALLMQMRRQKGEHAVPVAPALCFAHPVMAMRGTVSVC